MFYRIAKALVSVYLSCLFRIEVVGADRLPQTGAFIICANHINAHDPLVIAAKIKRRAYFLGKKELFGNVFLRRLFMALGAYPVDRARADIRAYKWALDVLKRGDGLGLFSQGTRYAERTEAAKNGVALFALKAQAPVVPCGISGTYGFLSRVRLCFGEPVTLDEYYGVKASGETLERITEGLMNSVYALADGS